MSGVLELVRVYQLDQGFDPKRSAKLRRGRRF